MSEPRRTWPVRVLPISRGRKARRMPHQAEGLQAHVAEVFRPPLAFVEAGPDLDLVADFAVAGQIARLEVAAGDPPGRLEFGAEVFGFLALVHQPGGIPGHLATESCRWTSFGGDKRRCDTGNGEVVGGPLPHGRLSKSVYRPRPRGNHLRYPFFLCGFASAWESSRYADPATAPWPFRGIQTPPMALAATQPLANQTLSDAPSRLVAGGKNSTVCGLLLLLKVLIQVVPLPSYLLSVGCLLASLRASRRGPDATVAAAHDDALGLDGRRPRRRPSLSLPDRPRPAARAAARLRQVAGYRSPTPGNSCPTG